MRLLKRSPLLPAVKWNARFGRVLFKLIISAGTVSVRAHQTSLPSTLLVIIGQLSLVIIVKLFDVVLNTLEKLIAIYLGTGGRFTGSLKTNEHYNVWLAF